MKVGISTETAKSQSLQTKEVIMSQYRSLDRKTNTAIFFASLLVVTMIFGSVTSAFGHAAQPWLQSDQIEEVVVQG
jgi:hypothetical protein